MPVGGTCADVSYLFLGVGKGTIAITEAAAAIDDSIFPWS